MQITVHDVACPGLSSALDGFTVAQLTDLHMTTAGSLHASVSKALHELRPDLLVITGDLTERAEHLAACEAFLRDARESAKSAIAIAGNWEHWGRIPLATLRTCYERAGFRYMGNEHTVLPDGLTVATTDDACSGNAMPDVAFRSLPAAGARLLLTHAAGWLEDVRDAPRFDLVLAGHTHGGQVTLGVRHIAVPPGSGPFVAGWYETAAGSLYVCRGLGTSVLPVRFACRPELAVFRLCSAPRTARPT